MVHCAKFQHETICRLYASMQDTDTETDGGPAETLSHDPTAQSLHNPSTDSAALKQCHPQQFTSALQLISAHVRCILYYTLPSPTSPLCNQQAPPDYKRAAFIYEHVTRMSKSCRVRWGSQRRLYGGRQTHSYTAANVSKQGAISDAEKIYHKFLLVSNSPVRQTSS